MNEEEIVHLVHNIINEVLGSLELENEIVEDLLLDDLDDEDIADLEELHVFENHGEDVHQVLIAAVANIQQLEEDEEFLLEDVDRVREGDRVYVDIGCFLTLRDETFHDHFRMDKETFEVLVLKVGNMLFVTDRMKRLCTGVDVALLMVLWILGNLSTFRGTAVVFGTAKSVVHHQYVVMIEILSMMARDYIKWPTAAQRDRTKAYCQRKNRFPGVVGFMDGTLIPVTAPLIQKEMYFDRHHSYSINVLAVCNHNLIFTHVYVGESGRSHDARVFSRSPLYNILLENPGALSGDEHILADGAYTLTDKVLVPHRDNGNLTLRNRRFNYFLSSLRMCIERSFGHLKEKMRRLYRLQVRNHDYALNHIMASLVLHNFIKLRGQEPDGMHFAAQEEENPDVIAEPELQHPLLEAAKAAGARKRNEITQLLTPG